MRWGSCAWADASTIPGNWAILRISALSRIAEPVQITLCQGSTPQIKTGENVPHVTQHGSRPGMGVLNIEHRVIARLLGDLDEIEIEWRVILTVKHHEANGPRAHFVHDIPERDERPGTFGHLDRLPAAKQADKLTKLDVELCLAIGQRGDRRLHALNVAAVVGPPDVDHIGEAASEFVAVIGHIGGEIGVAAIGLDKRSVHIIAELGGAEQE